MGSGSWTTASYADYSTSCGKSYDVDTNRVSGQVFTQYGMDDSLNPRNFRIRECVDSEEHPNTIPIILALDVTGSMGRSCQETAEALGVIMTELYEKYKDIEFCVMGIGDLAYDSAPIQMSQFESDVRIAEALDKIYMEHGGGGNAYESYTAAWYMALHRTSLDRINKQGKRGIIITMGDEPLNPYLPKGALNEALNGNEQGDVNTDDLYKEVSEKFDVYHIAVNDHDNCYYRYADRIESSFGKLLGQRLKISTVNDLSKTITECIDDSLAFDGEASMPKNNIVNENGEISW